MEQKILITDIVRQCRSVLCGITVQGPANCKALAAVYDDLGIVESYCAQIDAERSKTNDTKEDPKSDD